LYKRKEAPLEAIQLGGHHENNKRSGTINVSGIVGLGRAISLISDEKIKKDNQRIAELRDMLVDGVLKNVPDTILNTDRKNSTPAHAHFSFLGVEGESILISLDLEGIAVSTGSACASGSLEASHVLLAMGIKKEVAHNSIRFSLGRKNTKEEIKKVVKVLPGIIKRMRDMNPDYSS
jgi:cysteine desulfurase